MTFMLSNVRSSTPNDNHDHVQLTGTKRKSLAFLPSSPTKLKRVDRSHSRASSLSLLSPSSSISRLSPFSLPKNSKRARAAPKSPPTCTISLENVTVNICDEDRNLSKPSPRSTPLEAINVNIIPFPSATCEEPDPQSLPGLPISRRRRSNHLLGHRRSTSVRSISSLHGKENPSLPPTRPPKKQKPSSSSQRPKSSSFKDVRFIALLRRSILHGVSWRERMGLGDRMDLDEDYGSGSVTFDILSDSEDDDDSDESIDPCSRARIMHSQDILLADHLGKQLADWGYREKELSICPLRMPLAPVAISAVTISPPSFSESAIFIPDLQGHATSASFLDDAENVPMDLDVDRPERPVSPVARCLEPNDPTRLGANHSRQPLTSLLPPFTPSELVDSHVDLMVSPTPIPSPPPVSPGILSSQQRVLTPSQLVATLVLRHREKLAVRSRGSPQVEDRVAGRGFRRGSPLACEL
ncbi:hypothetical protein GYMLUDRAFT_32329 [Collybiopsis luxurians FD-317 M1]|nr:hypothetical protein GYMLUDRAFT_32329 [Collybiopsis luxurians FD-317 M1]